MHPRGIQAYFLYVLIGAALLLAAYIFKPFLAPLALAAAFAVVLQPIYRQLMREFNGHQEFAAVATLLIAIICIIVPLVVVGTLLVREVALVYSSFTDGDAAVQVKAMLAHFQASLPQNIPGVSDLSQTVAANVSDYGQAMLGWLAGHVGDAFSSAASILLNLFVFFTALFYFLRDGESFKRTLIELSPLPDTDDEMVLERLGVAINSVLRGNLLIALIRGVLAAIGFAFFGIPNIILWGALTAILGLIPGIGMAIVFIPVVAYAFFIGGAVPGLGLAAWGILAVGLVDNYLGPRLVGRGMKLHPLFVLLSILGGIALFGPVGIFLGPLSMSLLFALLSIYMSASTQSQS